MLSGDESALRLRALREALVAAGVEPDDIEISRLDGALDPGEWLAQAATAPFLTEKRIVVVRNALRSECPKGFESRLAGLPEWSLVILVADEETGDDSRQQRLKTIRKAWEAAVTAGGGKVESFDVGPKEVLAAIKKEASRLNKAISDRSAQLLSDMTGASLSRSIEELEKLSIYVGESDTIREGDIQALVVAAKEWNVFKLVDAIVHDNAAGAIRQLRILIGSPLKAEEAAFRSILPMLSRQMRLLWQARACIEAKVSPDRAPEALARSLPVKPNITKEPPYRQSNLMASARAANYVRLAGCFKLLGEADAKLKGVLPGYSAQETLEQCVLGMVAMFSRA
jgi:DNA polymerase-3 subunit delta